MGWHLLKRTPAREMTCQFPCPCVRGSRSLRRRRDAEGRIQVGAGSRPPAAVPGAQRVRGAGSQTPACALGSGPARQHPSPQRRPHGRSASLLPGAPDPRARVSRPRHRRRRLGRGGPGFAAAATVATTAGMAATSRGDSRGSGCEPAAAILTTNRRRVLRDGNQGERWAGLRAGGGAAGEGPERP